MAKFQTLDRVVLLRDVMGYPMGATGTIEMITLAPYPLEIRMDLDGMEIAAAEYEVERSQEPDPGTMVYITQDEVTMLRNLLKQIEYRQNND